MCLPSASADQEDTLIAHRLLLREWAPEVCGEAGEAGRDKPHALYRRWVR